MIKKIGFKRLIAGLLCTVMIFSNIPERVFATSEEPVLVQAEDTEYTFKQGYSGTFERNGATMVNSFDVNKYTTPSESALTSYLDKSNTPYYAWTVVAPKEGSYTIGFQGEYFSSWADCNNAGENPYVAVRVNDDDTLYQSRFMGSNGWYSETKDIAVSLKAGVNTLYAYPVTQEQKNYGSGYNDLNYNLDYIKLDGQLTAIKWQSTVENAGDAHMIYQFNNKGAGVAYIGGAINGTAKSNKMYVEGLNSTNVMDVPSYSYYISVPQDGYYDMTASFAGDKAANSNAFGLLVDGQPQVKKYSYRMDSVAGGWHVQDHHKVDVSTYLTEGIHLITVTMQLPATAATASSYSYSWTDLGPITFTGGISVVNMPSYVAATYGMENGYNNIEGTAYGDCVMDAVLAETSKLHTETQLAEEVGRVNPYVAYVVNAEKEGDYYVVPQFSGNVGSAYFMTVVANGAVSRSHRDIPVKVHLEEGRNVIYAVAFTNESVTALEKANQKSGYVNQQGLRVEENKNLTVVASKRVDLKAVDSSYINLYTKAGDNLGGANLGNNLKDLVIGSINQNNMDNFSYYSYTVNAPANGTYDIAWKYGIQEKYKSGFYFGLMVDGKMQAVSFDATHITTTGIALDLTKGNHIITIFQHIPKTVTDTQKYLDINGNVDSNAWTDQNTLVLYGGLTKAEEQKDPRTTPIVEKIKLTKVQPEGYGIVNGYSSVSADSVGGCYIDATVANVDNLQSDESLTEYVDKSLTPYVAYIVEAEKEGDYYIQPEYSVGGKVGSAFYMTVVVNGEDVYHVTKYEPQQVSLKEGRNVIYLVPFTKELKESLNNAGQGSGWIDQTGLQIAKGLTAVKADTLTVNAIDATYYDNFSKFSAENMLKEAATEGDVCNMTLEALKPASLEKVSYFSYTIEVPADGYYDISTTFDVDWLYRNGYYLGLMVDGEIYKVPFTMVEASRTAANIHNTADFSVYLSEGTHTLVFTQHLPENDTVVYDEWGYAWTNYMQVTFSGGITLASEQIDPVPTVAVNKIEAEDDTYVMRNLFGAYDADNMKQKSANASGGYVVGDIDFYNLNQTYDELETWLDKTNTAYLAYIVEAPTDGTYQLRVAYQMYIEALSDYRTQNGNPYMTILVNGEDTYKAEFGAGNDKIAKSNVEVTLSKGRNVIYFVPLTSDQKANFTGKYWCNVDYVAFDTELTMIKPALVVAEAEKSSYTGNFYNVSECQKASGGKYLAGASQRAMKEAGLTVETLSQDTLRKTPHFTYTIEVPANGYYDLTLGFASEGLSKTFGVLVDGKSYAAQFQNNHGSDRFDRHHADLSVYLTKGTHVIAIVSELPVNASARTGYGWSDFDALYLSGGITISEIQQNPYDKEPMTYLEAETWAYANHYEDVQEAKKYSGGAVVGSANAYKQSSEDAMKMLDVHEQDYVEYIVEAPKDGEYNIKVGIEFGSSKEIPSNIQQFVILYINGQAQKLEFNSSNGEVVGIPATANLVKGRNVIRVTGTTSDYAKATNSAVWCNHDFLAVEEGITAVKNAGGTKVEAEKLTYFNHFKKAEQKGASGDEIMGGSTPSAALVGVTTKNLSRENFDAASYIAFTVTVPADGYYTIYGNMQLLGGTQFGKVGLLVDDKAYEFKLWQNQWAGKNPAEATVYLTKGNHLIIATGLLGNTFSNNKEITWLDYDFFRLGEGLTLAKNQMKPTTLTKYTRYELEKYAMTNRFYIGKDKDLSGEMGIISRNVDGSQTYKQVESEGLSGVNTPYIQLTVKAPAEETYKIRLGMTYKYNGETFGGETEYAVLVNGELEKFVIPIYNQEYCKPFPVELEVKLNKGNNNLVITHALADEIVAECLVNSNYDYLDVSNGLELIASGGRIEAEESEYYGYAPNAEPSCSAGMSLMNEDWESVWSNNMTFKNLTTKNYKNVPYVRYTVVAEKAGTYYFGAGINSGGNNPEEEVYLGLSVNGGKFKKINFRKAWNNCALFTADLKEGENTILLTGTLKDFMDYPKFPSFAGRYTLFIDHDYLNLPGGVTAVKAEAIDLFEGDDEADIHDSLASVWGDFVGNGRDELPVIAIVIGGIAIAGLAGLGFIILFLKKKKRQL